MIARVLREIDDLPMSAGATPRSVRRDAQAGGVPAAPEVEVLELLDADERAELDGDDHLSHADACVISFEEYAQIQRALDEGLYRA